MRLSRIFPSTKFSEAVICEGISLFTDRMAALKLDQLETRARAVWHGNERWEFDTDEEFFAEYRKPVSVADYRLTASRAVAPYESGEFTVWIDGTPTTIAVRAPNRPIIEAVMNVFEAARDESRLPEPDPSPAEPPVVFIGHGRSAQWRDLKDHLHDHHGYDVEAYEVGARAGHAVRDILESMMERSSFGCLDEQADGSVRARFQSGYRARGIGLRGLLKRQRDPASALLEGQHPRNVWRRAGHTPPGVPSLERELIAAYRCAGGPHGVSLAVCQSIPAERRYGVLCVDPADNRGKVGQRRRRGVLFE